MMARSYANRWTSIGIRMLMAEREMQERSMTERARSSENDGWTSRILFLCFNEVGILVDLSICLLICNRIYIYFDCMDRFL
mmetsp:Transcript_22770/g.65637  ORF Transcript_22770/g.65637 Transcript_22770/m.65637 type:complete len:81 (+) Transcript_22770:11-253(+)